MKRWYLGLLLVFCVSTVQAASPKTGTPGITISAPTSAQAGDTITITATPANGAKVSWVALFTEAGMGGDLSAPPYTFTYTIPTTVIGSFKIGVIGDDIATETAYQAEQIIQVGTAATLTSLSCNQGVFLGQPLTSFRLDYYGAELLLVVEGTYSDGVVRYLTSPATGTTYTIQTPSVLQVQSDGTLKAIGEGSTTVTITNSGVSTTVNAQVDFVDPIRGDRTGGTGTNADLALTYSGPITFGTQTMPMPSSGAITLLKNASQASFIFHNNSGLPQLGVARGLVTWKLAGGSNANCAVSFTNNVLPTDVPPYIVTDGTIIFVLPPGGGKCVVNVNIAGLPDSQADKFTITNPAP